MGTSASSTGPGSGIPFDPPWLDDIELPQSDNHQQEENQPGDDHEQTIDHPEIAPPRRFQNARLMLRDFANSGDQTSFRKAVGHYSRTGMGGASNAAKRMRTSTRTATNLFGVLQKANEGSDPTINAWVTSLVSRSASALEIIDEIIRYVAPSGGSQDETSCRDSMAQALQDLLDESPNVNLLRLGDNDIWKLIESFLGYEAFNRLCLDLDNNQVNENVVLSPLERVLRVNEMQDYLKAELGMQIEKLRKVAKNMVSNKLQAVLETALQNTFLVYEGSL